MTQIVTSKGVKRLLNWLRLQIMAFLSFIASETMTRLTPYDSLAVFDLIPRYTLHETSL